eukprot:1533696-Rhodomonas_salina.1
MALRCEIKGIRPHCWHKLCWARDLSRLISGSRDQVTDMPLPDSRLLPNHTLKCGCRVRGGVRSEIKDEGKTQYEDSLYQECVSPPLISGSSTASSRSSMTNNGSTALTVSRALTALTLPHLAGADTEVLRRARSSASSYAGSREVP